MYCINKSMRGAELPRHLPHRNVGRAEIILHPRMGGHCVVPRNGPAYLGAKVVENGPAWRVLDDELEQLHRRIGQASSGFDEEDSEVIRVRGEVPEDGPIPSLFSRGRDLLDPRDAGRREDRVAVGIADCHIDVSPVGGGDETAVGPGRSRVPGEGATGAKVGDRLPGAGPIWRVALWPRASSQRSVTLVLSAGGSTRGSLGRTERMEE